MKTLTLNTNMKVHLNSEPLTDPLVTLLQIDDGKLAKVKVGKVVSIDVSLEDLRS